jgi:hypothetical protein
MGVREIRQYCQLDRAGEQLLEQAMRHFGLSARANDRIRQVARQDPDAQQLVPPPTPWLPVKPSPSRVAVAMNASSGMSFATQHRFPRFVLQGDFPPLVVWLPSG